MLFFYYNKLSLAIIYYKLINKDCVCLYQNKRGKYKLTEKGTKIVQEMQRKRN